MAQQVPEVQIYALVDDAHLETGWNDTGRAWHALHFPGHTVKEEFGGFPENDGLELTLSDTPGFADTSWIRGDFGGVVYFYPLEDGEAVHAGVVSCQLHLPTELFDDGLRPSGRRVAHGGPLNAVIPATRVEGGHKGDRGKAARPHRPGGYCSGSVVNISG
jgi:hypothetical protein